MSQRITFLGVVLVALAGCLAAWALMFGFGGAGTRQWTDGRTIRASEGSNTRDVMWTPPARVVAAGVGEQEEYDPRLSADGLTLYFVRGRPGHNADIMVSRRSQGGWSLPEPLAINTEHDELGPEPSADGSRLYFASNRPGGQGGFDIWVAERTGETWSAAENLGSIANSAWDEFSPALAPDAQTMYFSSSRPNAGETPPGNNGWLATVREQRTRPDHDLFAVRLNTHDGAPAQRLDMLNTPADDGTPALSPAGDFLYFSSDRPSAAGDPSGFDLYRARLTPGGNVLAPEHLDPPLNSRANDLDPAPTGDGFTLYFSSDREFANADRANPAYGLWTSASREVYLEDANIEQADWSALQDLWPWLLTLALLIALLVLLVRLLRDERWRTRLGRLSLIAQCLLLSVLIHAAIASLLAVWEISRGVIEIASRPGGGQRVILSSAAPGGSLASQIRSVRREDAAITLPESALVTLSLPAAASQSLPISLDLPSVDLQEPPVAIEPAQALSAPPLAPVQVPVATSATHTERLPEVVRASAQTEPESPRAEVDLPALTARALPSEPTHGEPDVAIIEPSPIQLDERPLLATSSAARAASAIDVQSPLELTRSESDAGREASLPAAPTMELETESRREITASSSIPRSRMSFTPESTGAGIVDMGLPAPPEASTADNGATEPIRPRATTSELGPARLAALGPATTAGDELLPSVAAPESRSGEESRPPQPWARQGSASLPVSPVLGVERERPVLTALDIAPALSSSDAAGNATSILPPSAPRAGGASESARSSEPLPLPDGRGSGGVVPLEDFAQRLPEVRDELLERMGGSGETERAVGLALDWFTRHQSSDGRWSAEHFDDGCGRCAQPAEVRADAAMTGMVLLCYLGAGHTHTREGPYREPVERGIRWLLRRQSSDGDLRAGETMYGQTVAAVALCEALAMTRDQDLADPARRAVRFVLNRASEGRARDERETSVIGWLVFTVESARRAGFDVPPRTFELATQWLDSVAVRGELGKYAYTRGAPPSQAMTAEAMFLRQLLGHSRTEPMMQRSAEFIAAKPPRWEQGAPTYSWYYATLALFQHQGEEWRTWNEALVRELLEHQESAGPGAGSWSPQDEWSRLGGRIYQTAVCTLCLEVYYRYRAE